MLPLKFVVICPILGCIKFSIRFLVNATDPSPEKKSVPSNPHGFTSFFTMENVPSSFKSISKKF